jgi:hypothetical protein
MKMGTKRPNVQGSVRRDVYVAYNFANVVPWIHPAYSPDLSSSDCHLFSTLMQNHVDNNIKDGRKLDTIVTLWLVTRDAGLILKRDRQIGHTIWHSPKLLHDLYGKVLGWQCICIWIVLNKSSSWGFQSLCVVNFSDHWSCSLSRVHVVRKRRYITRSSGRTHKVYCKFPSRSKLLLLLLLLLLTFWHRSFTFKF